MHKFLADCQALAKLGPGASVLGSRLNLRLRNGKHETREEVEVGKATGPFGEARGAI